MNSNNNKMPVKESLQQVERDELAQELELSTDAMMVRIAEEAKRSQRERREEKNAPADAFGLRLTF